MAADAGIPVFEDQFWFGSRNYAHITRRAGEKMAAG